MNELRDNTLKVLQLSVHFPPNVGGVETHLWDLVTYLSKKEWQVFVLCYKPLSAKGNWKIYERLGSIEIFRIPWIDGLFYKFIQYPKLEFLYLFPGLFIFTPVLLLLRRPKVIHAHGIVAGFVAAIWGKLFNLRIIISTHSLYTFPKNGLYSIFAKFIFKRANKVLCLSEKSYEEIKGLGLDEKKLTVFTYWIDLNKFRNKKNTKKDYNWEGKFIVLFVGRLVAEKGIRILLDSVKSWDKRIDLVLAGIGPLEEKIKKEASKNAKIHFLGKVDQDDLPNLYSAADILIVPSVAEEGFGRVIMESLACSTPVIASNKGAITEAMDESVGELIDITAENIKNAVENLFKDKARIEKFKKNTREFVERRYSEDNAVIITKSYTG